jgi:hypothetical protein
MTPLALGKMLTRQGSGAEVACPNKSVLSWLAHGLPRCLALPTVVGHIPPSRQNWWDRVSRTGPVYSRK